MTSTEKTALLTDIVEANQALLTEDRALRPIYRAHQQTRQALILGMEALRKLKTVIETTDAAALGAKTKRD